MVDERSLEGFFRQRVRLVGGYTIKLAPVERGVPDRLVLFPGGRMYLVELKTTDGTVEPHQKAWHLKAAEKYGIKVYVVRGREGIIRWVRMAVNEDKRTTRRRRAS